MERSVKQKKDTEDRRPPVRRGKKKGSSTATLTTAEPKGLVIKREEAELRL